MAGSEGPRGFRPTMPYALTGEGPSREGARGMAGAVYLLLSSPQPGCGVPLLGQGYPAPPGNMLEAVLVLEDTGDSATGEKYESPPRGPGDGCVGGAICVWRDRGTGG